MGWIIFLVTGFVAIGVLTRLKIRYFFGGLSGAVRILTSRRRLRRVLMACGLGDGRAKLVGVVPTANGAVAQVIPELGQSLRQWQLASDALGLALGVPAVSAFRDGPQAISLALTVRDVLQHPLPAGHVSASRDWSLWLGVDEMGQPVNLYVANHSAIVIGGVPGSGKSVAVVGLLAQWAERSDVRFAVIDGKSGGDLQVLRGRAWAYEDDIVGVAGLVKARDLLSDVRRSMQSRLDALKSSSGPANFWAAYPERASADFPLLVTVVDECQTILDARQHVDKEARLLSNECAAIVEDLVRRGRAAGVLTILATQKPTAESVPTGIRDNAGLRIAFSVMGRPSAEAILGDAWSTEAPISPIGAPVGVAVVGPRPLRRIRTPLYSESALARAFAGVMNT